MRLNLKFIVLLAACAAVGSCSKPKKPPVPVERFQAKDLVGRWAWSGQENCWGKGNYILFEQPPAVGGTFRITVYHFEQEPLIVEDAQVRTTTEAVDKAQKPVVLVRYELLGQAYEEHYLLKSSDEMHVLKSLVNGEPQERVSITDPNRLLVRCKAEAH